MTRILLADHSQHAQRMGERILRDEGFSVVTVSDGETAMLRLKDVHPAVVIADVRLNGYSGFEICEWIKGQEGYRQTAVLLTAGALDTVDEARITGVKADGFLRKPFAASELLAFLSRLTLPGSGPQAVPDRAPSGAKAGRSVVVLDREQVRAAVTVALDEALEPMIDRVTERVIAALSARK